jgi:NitT/TauT family transport system substrate-binding protein
MAACSSRCRRLLASVGLTALLMGCSAPARTASPAGGATSGGAPAGAPSGGAAGAPSAPAGSGAPAASTPAAPIKSRSGYTTIAAAAAPWWVALEGGYFREQGLDVDLIHLDAGSPLLAALTNGELDVTFSGAPTLVLGTLQGLDTVIIGSTANVLDGVVFTRPEVKTVQDLRGKTIGVTNLKAITDVVARLGVKRLGLEPDVDVFTRRTGGLAESLAALETGAIDAASLNVPAVFEARKRGFTELIDVTKMGIPFLSSAVGATRKTLTEKPELGEPYLRALAQASSRLKTDREFGIQVLGKYTASDDRDLLAETIDYYAPIYAVDLYPELASVQAVLDIEENPAARTAKPEDMVDQRFAAAVRASGFLDQLAK